MQSCRSKPRDLGPEGEANRKDGRGGGEITKTKGGRAATARHAASSPAGRTGYSARE